MLGILLITWKNGRTVKTSGANRLEQYNMKIIFICIVIVISCSVCASGGLEIYPGLKLDLSPEEHRPRIENDEKIDFYGGNYRRLWQRLPFRKWDAGKAEQDYDLELPEQRQKLEEFLEQDRSRFDREEDFPVYYNPRSRADQSYDEYKSRERSAGFDRYDLRYLNPNSQILDDVRPYPHDTDFSFGDDDLAEEVDPPATHRQRYAYAAVSPGETETRHSHMADALPTSSEKNSEDISEKGPLEEAQLVEDPSQFAYPPSDPRFFQNFHSDNDDQKIRSKFEKIKDNTIRLIHRSDEELDTERDRYGIRKHYGSSDSPEVNVVHVQPHLLSNESAGVYIIAVVAGISAAATIGLIAVGIGWYNSIQNPGNVNMNPSINKRKVDNVYTFPGIMVYLLCLCTVGHLCCVSLQKHVKNASDVEYPAYGVTGPNKDISPSGDRRLAQSAQMYHYQHQKQQIIAMESRAAAGERHGSVSEADSDEENEEGDYTVYECPGLAPTGEMEVKNPLFQDDPTPAQTPPVKPNGDEKK